MTGPDIDVTTLVAWIGAMEPPIADNLSAILLERLPDGTWQGAASISLFVGGGRVLHAGEDAVELDDADLLPGLRAVIGGDIEVQIRELQASGLLGPIHWTPHDGRLTYVVKPDWPPAGSAFPGARTRTLDGQVVQRPHADWEVTREDTDGRVVRRPHADWEVTREDIRRWYAAHPGTFPGFDVAPIILNERLAAAADRMRAAYSDVPEVLIQDQLRELWESRFTSSWRTSMVDGLVERIAAYLPLPMGETSTVPDARLLPRRPGRPAWTRALFLERWQEAASMAAADPDGPRRRLGRDPSLADIAVVFRSLDGTQGMTPESLRRLRRRFMPTTAK